MNKIKGTVVSVSEKNFGVNIDNVWYNATEKAKKYVKSSLKNSVVEIELIPDSNKYFNFIKVVGSASVQESNNPVFSKEAFWEEKNKRDIENSKRISIHGALNTAVKLVEIAKSKNEEKIEADKLLEISQYLAGKILDWMDEELEKRK